MKGGQIDWTLAYSKFSLNIKYYQAILYWKFDDVFVEKKNTKKYKKVFIKYKAKK